MLCYPSYNRGKFRYIISMKSQTLFNLNQINSFAVSAICPTIFYPESINDLKALYKETREAFYILGEGTNTLFVDEKAPVIIKPAFKGIEFSESAEHFIVDVAASENWHELVGLCLTKGVYGLENLALIPGSVGAAPVQNIGAYGVEFSQYCEEVHWFEFSTQKSHKLSHQACEFGYRNSVFKGRLKDLGVITHIRLKLPKKWQPVLSYQGLDDLEGVSSAQEIMAKVITLRESKLPDPKELPNAGSFFKNPEIDQKTYLKLLQTYPNMPAYILNEMKVKLAAGWLIEQCNLKGFKRGEVGVHTQQALVLVNYASHKGEEIVELAAYIQSTVFKKFAIVLEPEVRAVYTEGEGPMKLESLYD